MVNTIPVILRPVAILTHSPQPHFHTQPLFHFHPNLTKPSMITSSSSSRYNHMTLATTHCKCPFPIEEQVAWTIQNPEGIFKACSIYLRTVLFIFFIHWFCFSLDTVQFSCICDRMMTKSVALMGFQIPSCQVSTTTFYFLSYMKKTKA